MKNNILKFKILAFVGLLYSLPLFAQPDNPPTDDEVENPAPIDNWIMLLIFVAIFLGIYLTMKFNKKSVA